MYTYTEFTENPSAGLIFFFIVLIFIQEKKKGRREGIDDT